MAATDPPDPPGPLPAGSAARPRQPASTVRSGQGVLLDAYVLPRPGGSLGVVVWDRVRRGGTGAALSVYAPGDLSPGEMSEIGVALTSSVGDALGEARGTLPPAAIAGWWIAGSCAALLLALHALDLGPAFSWLAVLAVGATLPWGRTRRAFGAARAAQAARRVAPHLGQLEISRGADQRTRERLMGVWQFARGQRGAEQEQLRGLERFCREQAWPAAAAIYADRQSTAGGEDAPEMPRGRARRPRGPRLDPAALGSRRLYAACEMRAWPSN